MGSRQTEVPSKCQDYHLHHFQSTFKVQTDGSLFLKDLLKSSGFLLLTKVVELLSI